MASRLSLSRIEMSAQTIDAVFRNSPQFLSEPISEVVGARIVLKVETINPIRSFKGRGADFFLSQMGAGPTPLVCASAGNFGQGLAYCARKYAKRVVIYAAETANPMKVARMRDFGAEIVFHGQDFDAAKHAAQEFARNSGSRFVEDGREIAISEGAGSIGVELCRWPDRFDFALIPLGNGALISGVARWLKAHSPQTRVIGVCAAGAPSMALSFKENAICETATATTIADGIAIRVPVPEALQDMEGVVDEILLVDDAALIEAMKLVFHSHGIVTEPAGVAGLAAAIVNKERFRKAAVATPICGGNLHPDRMRDWLY